MGSPEATSDDQELTRRLRDALGWADEGDLQRRLQERVAGDYEVLGPLGRGAAGVVFKARDVRLNRPVAIKCPADSAQRGRLVAIFDEARTLAQISHPNVAAVYALSESPDPPIMVMEFVDGAPIDEALAGQPIDRQLAVFRQVLAAVAELHRRGIVHRDLKPGNILVDRGGTAKVLDMGIAEPMAADGPAGAAPTSVAGTPAYLAPEQSRGAPARPSADVFSLGVVLFEILTGQRPFHGDRAADLVRAICETPAPLPRSLRAEIPGPLQAIMLAALEKDPARRYPTAQHFLLDLDRFLGGEAVIADPTVLQDVLEHGITRHVGDLDRWHNDRLISRSECDYFVDKYERLRDREEFWVLDSRRISFSQVALHLGAWGCVVAAFLAQRYQNVGDGVRTALPLVIFAVLLGLGVVLWRRQNRRVALVLLMAASMVWPLFVYTLLDALKLRLGGSADDMLWLTNPEWLIVTGSWAVLCLLFWNRTKTSAFALLWTLSAVALATAVFALMGMKNWKPDEIAAHYLVPGAVLLGIAIVLDLGWRKVYVATPLYIIGLAIVVAAATKLALDGPTTRWVGVWAMARELGIDEFNPQRQIYYSFMLNGAAYLVFGLLAYRSTQSRSLRRIATILFWLAPSHLLIPVFRLEHERVWRVLPHGWSVPEVVLLVGALAFVLASVPKQMKSFFFSGLAYVALGLYVVTVNHFEDVFAWPIILAVGGLALAVVAWKRPAMFDRARSAPTPAGLRRDR
jgi:serine/threonine protein kinase